MRISEYQIFSGEKFKIENVQSAAGLLNIFVEYVI